MKSTALGIHKYEGIELYSDGTKDEIESIPYDQHYPFDFDLWPAKWHVDTYLRACDIDGEVARELAYRYLTDPLYRYAVLGIPRPLPVNHHNLIAVIDAEGEPIKAILGRAKAPGQIEVLAARLYPRAILTFAMATAVLEKNHYTVDPRVNLTTGLKTLLATRHARVTADEWLRHVIQTIEGVTFTR